jgi:hypothetical protein
MIAKANSAAVVPACGVNGYDLDVLRRALSRNPDGSAAGPLGRLIDLLLSEEMP